MFNPFMHAAIESAKSAGAKGEIPVGAVIVKNGEIIARGENFRETSGTALGHAEIAALHAACESLSSWRLRDCDIYVTLEPCPMCAGAILGSGMRRIYFGAYDKKAGALGSTVDLSHLGCYGKSEIYGGIMEKECDKILKTYFTALRERNGG